MQRVQQQRKRFEYEIRDLFEGASNHDKVQIPDRCHGSHSD